MTYCHKNVSQASDVKIYLFLARLFPVIILQEIILLYQKRYFNLSCHTLTKVQALVKTVLVILILGFLIKTLRPLSTSYYVHVHSKIKIISLLSFVYNIQYMVFFSLKLYNSYLEFVCKVISLKHSLKNYFKNCHL